MAATQRRSCEGKHPFPSKADAEEERWRLIRRKGASPNTLNVYKCKFGPHWHVGHPVRRRFQR